MVSAWQKRLALKAETLDQIVNFAQKLVDGGAIKAAVGFMSGVFGFAGLRIAESAKSEVIFWISTIASGGFLLLAVLSLGIYIIFGKPSHKA